ncbi:MAG TPA: heparan-alpha-glucosaminide N-acetyltransferase domain-containing protein [Vicinamibacteria bacterium]|nr:heparan-alpha-glucosaminide N-acetyltransferase domain-containing protein [Vicinamibacteria bacterium]
MATSLRVDGPGPAAPAWDGVERRKRPRHRRELYIDAFRGLMALVMVQGHVFNSLLQPLLRQTPAYEFQLLFHGSTAPGFLFASGFVAGFPRSPLSVRATVRRARRLLFVLGVGYMLHLPYLSFWKTMLEATPAEKAALFAADALHVIAVSQLFVLGLQWLAGPRWIAAAAATALLVLAAGPFVWAAEVSAALPLALGAYFDRAVAPSQFPVFPFAAFVLAGTVAGAALGRQHPERRHRRAVLGGLGLIAVGILVALALKGTVGFWGVSPGYALIRMGGLLLLLRLVEAVALREVPGMRALALLGHETLLVYVLHLFILFGGVLGAPPLGGWHGRLGFASTFAVLLSMVPVLLLAAWAWHRLKAGAPHAATSTLIFLGTALLWEFFTRPW